MHLDEPGEVGQCHPGAGLVVGGGHAVGNPFVHDQDVSAAVGIGERGRDRHGAAERGICGLELEHFDYLLVRYEPGEVAVVGVGTWCRLAGPVRRVVAERDPERAAFAGIELMHVAGHAFRHSPFRDRVRIQERLVDSQTRSVHVSRDPRRIHPVNLPSGWPGDRAAPDDGRLLRRSPSGPAAYSFHNRGRKEDQRGCHGTQAHRYERDARLGSDIRSGKWRRRIKTERFRHMMPPENLKIDCVPAKYPDDAADPPQPSHRQISGWLPRLHGSGLSRMLASDRQVSPSAAASRSW